VRRVVLSVTAAAACNNKRKGKERKLKEMKEIEINTHKTAQRNGAFVGKMSS
jgi:hypothetical protein